MFMSKEIYHGYDLDPAFNGYASYKREQLSAALFGLVSLVFLCAMLVVIFSSSGPLVVGTEINPNGSVEYLCLGRGCEDLNNLY